MLKWESAMKDKTKAVKFIWNKHRWALPFMVAWGTFYGKEILSVGFLCLIVDIQWGRIGSKTQRVKRKG